MRDNANLFGLSQSLIDSVKKIQQEETEYQAKVKAHMAKKGIKSLSDLTPEEKKKFFSDLDAAHKAKNEEFSLSEGVLSKFKKADAQTKTDFNKYNMKPYDAVYTVTMGAKGEPKYDLTILKHENGKFLAAHGSVVVKQEFAKAEDAAKWLMNWYEENKRPAAKNESVEESTGVTDYNPKSQGGTRKELIAKYHKTKNPKDAEAARKAGATQKELQSEEVEIEEGKSSTGYELYHKDFSSAMAHAYDFAKKKYNIEIDPFEIDRKVAMGPKKPSSGKSNAYRLLDKTGKKAVQVQVANLDNQRYELNMYKEDLDEQNDPPFDPDPPKKKSDVVPGKHGSGPSMAKRLAKMALKNQMDKKKDVKEDAEQVAEKVVKGKGYDNPENERKSPEGKVPMTSLMPGHSDKAARFAAVQAKGKLVKGKAQSAPQKEEFDPSILDEAFSPAMVAKLKAEYSKIDRIDPSSDSYKKLTAMLDKMDMKELESLADAGIKFVSGLAKNRVSRNAMKRGEGSKGKNYLMSKNEEVEIEESDDMGPAKRGKEKPVMMRHKTSGKEISVVPSGVKEKQKLGYEVVKEEVEQIDEVKVGDTVHVGMAKKGGAGFKGTVHKIDGEKVHVKVGTTKYGDRIVAGQMKNVTKEEMEIDTSKKAKPAFKNAKKAGEDMGDSVKEQKHPEDMDIPSNKLEPEGTKKWLAVHGKHLKYLKNLKKAPAYEEKEIEEEKPGLWANIRAKKARIKQGSGERMRKPGEKGAPTPEQLKRAKNESVNEAEGGGTEVQSLKTQALNQKKRAEILAKSAELKLKQEREREALRKQREAVKEAKVPEFKTGGKPLAKKFEKAMAAMGIKAKIKMRTVNNISMNELFTEAMKKDKKEKAPSEKDKLKKGEALSGKREPVEVSPEMNPAK